MFAMPMACLLLMVSGQAGKVDENTDPETLLRMVEPVVVKGQVLEIMDLQQAIMGALKKTKDAGQKEKLKQGVWVLEKHKESSWQRSLIQKNSTNKRDQSIPLFANHLNSFLYEGKSSFISRRNELEDFLRASTSEALVDQMGKFGLRKMLVDMDRLIQLDQDPVKRAETDKFFALLVGLVGAEEPDLPYPAGLGETPWVKKCLYLQEEAGRLLGPTSLIRFKLLTSAFITLANECCRGQMPDVDLQAEMDREFAPFLNSDWAQNWGFKLGYGGVLARFYLSPKGKDYEKLAKLIKELEAIKGEYGDPESNHFLDIISYRLLMLNQQGRHQECIQEFEKIKNWQLSQALNWQKLFLVDIHLSAAQSYEALGKKDRALLQQEIAYDHCFELTPRKHYLVRFKKSVAKELRDKYAKNNQWKEARSLEECCQLLGLGFDPLPKQAFEMAGAAPSVLNQPPKASTGPPPNP